MDGDINSGVFSMIKGVMGDNFSELVETFITNSDLYVQAINDGHDTGDYEKIKKAAHPLKSSSAMIGFDAFADCAKQTEILAKNHLSGHPSEGDIHEVIGALNSKYNDVKTFLNTTS